MSFRPSVGTTLNIFGEDYVFVEHPFAQGMPFGQSGRRATIYQVRASSGELYALKIFTKVFRNTRNKENAGRIAGFSDIPGLQVCSRMVLTPDNSHSLIQENPDLSYAVLMPWIYGQTWQEVVLQGQTIQPGLCYLLSTKLSTTLATMEQRHIAHCDLSGPNVLVSNDGVFLVDVEDIYAPVLAKPEILPAGSLGYSHRTAHQGLWAENADRFAGAILLAEMLCWYNPRIVKSANGENYFAPNELQTQSTRYKDMLDALRMYENKLILDLFSSVWDSQSLDDCPTISEWNAVLQSNVTLPNGFQPSLGSLESNYSQIKKNQRSLEHTVPIRAIPKKGSSASRSSATFPWTPIIWTAIIVLVLVSLLVMCLVFGYFFFSALGY